MMAYKGVMGKMGVWEEMEQEREMEKKRLRGGNIPRNKNKFKGRRR